MKSKLRDAMRAERQTALTLDMAIKLELVAEEARIEADEQEAERGQLHADLWDGLVEAHRNGTLRQELEEMASHRDEGEETGMEGLWDAVTNGAGGLWHPAFGETYESQDDSRLDVDRKVLLDILDEILRAAHNVALR